MIVISAKDIEKNKIRGDLGITYDTDVLRLIDTYREQGLYVGSVTITQFSGQESALLFKNRLEKLDIPVYLHYVIPGILQMSLSSSAMRDTGKMTISARPVRL